MNELANNFYSQSELIRMPKFFIQGCYKKMVGDIQKVHWGQSIWNRLVVLKQRTISWMIMLEKLRTTDRLRKIGVKDADECVLCGVSVETHKHLFFECEFTRKCLSCW